MESHIFNRDWTFWKEENEEHKKIVQLPHDAMLAENRLPKLKNGPATAYFPGGKYVYTKNLFADKQMENKSVLLEFEGIYQKSKIFLNNEEVGGWIYGYTNFYVDLTGRLKIGKENEIKVIADNSQTPNSRWYTGSGIYRDVKLIIGNKKHIRPDGVKIITKSYDPAVIQVKVETANADGLEVKIKINKDGQCVATGSGNSCEISIPDAKLWNDAHPNLYEANVMLVQGDEVFDETVVRFGIRKLDWNVQKGLQVNGQTVKLKGGCVHHDNGLLGACEFEEAAYRRIRLLKEAGYNAIRSAHNPASKAQLRACDELGMYAMDETFDMWLTGKSDYDYSLYFEREWKKDVASMINKDFNHPSVIMYSIGNEITDIAKFYGHEINKKMADFCREKDPTRPVTNSVNAMTGNAKPKNKEKPKLKVSPDDLVDPTRAEKDSKLNGSVLINTIVTMMPFLLSLIKPEAIRKNMKGLMDHLDVTGFNYGSGFMEALHDIDPNRLLLSTETFPKDIGKNWPVVMRNNHIIGDFMWTAWDYLGEAGLGVILYGKNSKSFMKPYPCISAYIGSFDLTGVMESQGYYTAVVWNQYQKPYIGVRPVNHSGEPYFMGTWRGTDTINSWSWNCCEGRTAEIHIFSQGAEVELYQDGKSLGRGRLEEYKAIFTTTYQAGELKAVSYNEHGHELGSSFLKTAGSETTLTVCPEKTILKANGEDLAFINISLTDEEGIVKVMKEATVSVTVEGAAVLQGIGSGNPITTESYLGNSFTTYYGRMQAIVRSNMERGEVRVTVSSGNLVTQVMLRVE